MKLAGQGGTGVSLGRCFFCLPDGGGVESGVIGSL